VFLFADEAWSALAAGLASSLGVKTGGFDAARFTNGEIYIRLQAQVRGEECAILGSVAPPGEQMLHTLLLADTLKKEGARRVTAILPYLAYARHDKDKPGESLAAAWLGAMMRASGVDDVITVDLHSERAARLLALPVRSISPAPIFAAALRQCGWSEATILAPDEGAIGRSEAVQVALGRSARAVPYFDKRRTEHGIVHTALIGEAGAQVVIVDDILDTGATLMSACEKLTQAGVREINVMVTHGLFTGDRWKKLFELGVERIFCTDSIPLPPHLDVSRIVRLPVAPLLVQAMTGKGAGGCAISGSFHPSGSPLRPKADGTDVR